MNPNPLDPDPRSLTDDELVELLDSIPRERRHARRLKHRRALQPIHVLLAGLLGVALGFLVAHATLAASRGAHADRGLPEASRRMGASPDPAAAAQPVAATPVVPPGDGRPTSTLGPILEPGLTASPAPRAVVEQPPGEVSIVTPKPVVVLAPTSGAHGPASWYDDPRKAGMYAAAGPALRVGDWRGRTVTVCASTCFALTLSDFCACPGGRVIDLSSTAFARLAPLTRGVIEVTVTW